jgi:hypothetical protein
MTTGTAAVEAVVAVGVDELGGLLALVDAVPAAEVVELDPPHAAIAAAATAVRANTSTLRIYSSPKREKTCLLRQDAVSGDSFPVRVTAAEGTTL